MQDDGCEKAPRGAGLDDEAWLRERARQIRIIHRLNLASMALSTVAVVLALWVRFQFF